MKILLCSEQVLKKEVGISKPLIELAEELEILGWHCQLASPQDVGCHSPGLHPYTQALTTYLQHHAHEFDVVDYPCSYLPGNLAASHCKTLFVARSALLPHNFDTIRMPIKADWYSRVKHLTRLPSAWLQQQSYVANTDKTVQVADLVNVNNQDDRTTLIQRGVPAEKVVAVPLGISRERRALFNIVSSQVPDRPIVANIATFDPRKGCLDMPSIIAQIAKAIPQVRLRLLGTMRPVEQVLSYFPAQLHPLIDVIPRFEADKLPELLADCSVGMFPSYLEGFGLGVLEMLAASVPVVAYNTPGPPMILPADYLVQRGDRLAMASRLIELLQHQDKLAAARGWAKQQSQAFCWQRIAQQTHDLYQKCWEKKVYGQSQSTL